MKKYFYSEESMNPGMYMIRVNFDVLPNMHTSGSYNVLAARVVGLSYAQYLRMCRDEFGAELIGKGNTYVLAYFDTEQKADKLAKFLNERLDWILSNRQYVECDE